MIEGIEALKNEIGSLVKKRVKEFEENRKSNKKIFLELCFCILTANFNAKKAIEIQEKIGDNFFYLSEEELEKELKNLGHRFPKTRARYIIKARKYKNLLKKIIENFKDEKMLREWLANNIKGIGYKEASHFLRNIGFKNLAIIDFHILELLEKNKIIKRPKTLSKKKYLEIENILSQIGKKLNLSLAELDLYLWYMETGKILK
ncbi:MAG: N-glycosylase/DNA lyase [Candidatus Aenigmatarchaeota archaeon]